MPVPRRAGDPSLIEHVVYIIKENRTYDQLFGDLRRGNGDPSLVMFGEDVTPNHRKLATEFVLLDNFYATGGNSGDGHQWVTQANETAYALWPGYVGRSYPFDGTDPLAYANTGFLWDLARARGKTVKVFGEYAGRLPENDLTATRDTARAMAARRGLHAGTGRHRAARAAQRRSGRQLSALLAVDSRRRPRADLSEGSRRVDDAQGHDAQPRDPAVAERPHARRDAGLLDARSDGGGQRPGARPDRRSAVEEPVLAEDGDSCRRRRRAERRRSR